VEYRASLAIGSKRVSIVKEEGAIHNSIFKEKKKTDDAGSESIGTSRPSKGRPEYTSTGSRKKSVKQRVSRVPRIRYFMGEMSEGAHQYL